MEAGYLLFELISFLFRSSLFDFVFGLERNLRTGKGFTVRSLRLFN